MANPPGLIVPRVHETHDPDWSNSLVRRERTEQLFHSHHFTIFVPLTVSFFFMWMYMWGGGRGRGNSFFSHALSLSNFKLTDTQTLYSRYFYCTFIERIKCKFITEGMIFKAGYIISKKHH